MTSGVSSGMSDEPSADAPLFSVVICTYNRTDALAGAIRSVLDQSFEDFELVVVDDGSTDDTRAVVTGTEDGRVRYVHRSNGGLSAARNTGARAARGRVLMFLDDDDRFMGTLLAELATISGGDDRVVVCWGAEVVDERGNLIETMLPRPLGAAFAGYRGLFNAGTFALSRELYLEVGGFEEELRTSHQTEFALRLLPVCRSSGIRVATIDEALTLIVERDPGNRSRNDPDRLLRATLLILQRHEEQLALSPQVLSDYLATAGVAAGRGGEYGQARRLLVRAARHATTPSKRWRNLARAGVATAPPVARRVWPRDLGASKGPAETGS